MKRPILNKVTVTGADDSTTPEILAEIQKEFPFVEWGILVSEHRTLKGGCARFPTPAWLSGLQPSLNLSTHLCGRWVRQLCKGDWSWMADSFAVGMLLSDSQRVQFNFHACAHTVDRTQMAKDIKKQLPGRQVICQIDGVNNDIVNYLYAEHCNVAALYDASGGAGKLPVKWEDELPGIYCGYAGGLSPDNVVEQLELIEGVADVPSWIDAETHLRSEDNETFDIDKVRAFLKAAEPWVLDV